MNPFDPFASAHTALWSLFACGPAGLAAQFFIDPQESDGRCEPKAGPHAITHEPAPLPGGGASATLRTGALRVKSAVLKTGSPQWLSCRFEHAGETQRFKLYVPGGYNGQPLPLIVMLHGAQQDPDDFATGTRMNATAEDEGYIVVYPEQSASANPLRCWNWFRPGDQTRESGESAMIAALTREVMAMCEVDEGRVFVAGMSAGGAMAVNLAVTHSDLYAAAAIHSGVAFGVASEPMSALCAMNDGMGKVRLRDGSSSGLRPRAVPMIVFHGDADDTVHPRNGDQIVAMRALLLGDPRKTPSPALTRVEREENGHAYTRHVFHDDRGVPIGEQWLVHGLGHAWSGGHPGGTHTDARGPDATREIVRFFGQIAIDSRTVE